MRGSRLLLASGGKTGQMKFFWEFTGSSFKYEPIERAEVIAL